MQKVVINPVFTISVAICGAFGVWGIIAPDQMTGAAHALTGFALDSLDWLFLLLTTGFVVLSLLLAASPYGNIKLGADDDEPEFAMGSWIAMLFAGGMGAGLLFWGAAEPIYHYHAPPGGVGDTPEAARQAMVITNLHWGLHAWAIYAICALVIAYFVFRKNAPSLISTPIRAAFSGPGIDTLCRAADVLGVVAVIFGLAGSLSMGTLQVRAGMGEVFGLPQNTMSSIYIIVALAACFYISASTGVDKGIKILSNLNMLIAIVVMLFIIFVGPTRFIMETFVTTFGDYLGSLIPMAFRLFPYEGLTDWSAGWTLTYLIWWLAWGPFVGVFIARISRGRTIRQFMVGVVLIPSLFSMLWFSAFGGAAFYIEFYGPGGIAELVFEDVTSALFALFNYFPLSSLLSVLGILLIFIFLVTSADSGTFVVSMMTSEGNLNPPTPHKMIWAVIITAITVATLFTGSVEVAKAMAITGAIPFSAILLLQIIAFLRVLKADTAAAARSGRRGAKPAVEGMQKG